ncbi:Uncharacterised protein [Salmonella sp. NCTC 11881]|nr:Uncharacterised protein [Salmonella sp. NCTC 11881]
MARAEPGLRCGLIHKIVTFPYNIQGTHWVPCLFLTIKTLILKEGSTLNLPDGGVNALSSIPYYVW